MRTKFFLVFICHSIFSFAQKDADKIKNISKKNGEILVESVYPVDTSMLSVKKVWLDSNFQVTKQSVSEGVYFINQTFVPVGICIDKLRNKRPTSYKIDSLLILPSEFSLEKQKIQIVKGCLTYKKSNKVVDYIIENGRVLRIELWTKKRTRLLANLDYSGLYKGDNKTWPVHTMYDKSGNVKQIRTDIYYKNTIYFVDWKY